MTELSAVIVETLSAGADAVLAAFRSAELPVGRTEISRDSRTLVSVGFSLNEQDGSPTEFAGIDKQVNDVIRKHRLDAEIIGHGILSSDKFEQ